MALYLFLLPLLSRVLSKKWSLSPPIIDLWVARGSSLFGVLGPILLGVASSPVLLVMCTFTPVLFGIFFIDGKQHLFFSPFHWDTRFPSSHTGHR